MSDHKNTNILIVDDDKFLLDMYSIKFEESGFEVTGCRGSTETYDKIKGGFQPDVILLDIIMPTMDGFELLEKLNDEKLLSDDVTVIMLTNLGQEDDIKRGKELGVKGYIVKATATPTEVVKEVSVLAGVAGEGEKGVPSINAMKSDS